MTLPESDLVDAVNKIKLMYDRLYDSADGDTGDIPDIKNHLKELNGTVAELKANQLVIQGNQDRLLSRIFCQLPPWGQKLAVIICGLLTLGTMAGLIYLSDQINDLIRYLTQ